MLSAWFKSFQKKKSVNQNDKVADDEIRELVNDLSKQIVKTPVKQSVAEEPNSERYVGSVASDPAVLALLYSNDQEYNKKKRSMKKQKPTPTDFDFFKNNLNMVGGDDNHTINYGFETAFWMGGAGAKTGWCI